MFLLSLVIVTVVFWTMPRKMHLALPCKLQKGLSLYCDFGSWIASDASGGYSRLLRVHCANFDKIS